MTQRTQAQIEAAAKALDEIVADDEFPWNSMLAATSALTAAAEVGDGNHERADEMRGLFKGVADHTIERCAQVAEKTITDDASWANGRARNIAAAIRALKDKP